MTNEEIKQALYHASIVTMPDGGRGMLMSGRVYTLNGDGASDVLSVIVDLLRLKEADARRRALQDQIMSQPQINQARQNQSYVASMVNPYSANQKEDAA